MANDSRDSIRVRFAPSPTGFLHVGGARTAIFNWLFARGRGGTFVVRIEDTDVERSSRESEAALIDDLRWLGLEWDEGPDAVGDCGPYRQSERLDTYRRRAAEWIGSGRAYPCFCTDDELAAKRDAARKAGRPPQYDGACRDLSPAEIAARRGEGRPEAIRFRMPDDEEVIRFHDHVRGDIELATSTVGDFVLVRSNGRPTYNFAAALDDHAMGITHVLRGEEHLPNTLRQILIYHALGASIPQFAHLPLILAEDRSKLSKRHGASSVEDLRRMGFLPDAVVNYLVLLGWSHPGGKELLTRETLTKDFSLDRINKAAAVFDRKKLAWMNGQYIRQTPLDALFPAADAFFPDAIASHYSEADRREILRILQDSLETLADLTTESAVFRSPLEIDAEAMEALRSPEAAGVLAAVAAALARGPEPLTAAGFKAMMKDVAGATGLKGKTLFLPVRAALTGAVHGPDLASVVAIKGRKAVSELVRRASQMSAS